MKFITILFFLTISFLFANNSIVGTWYSSDGQRLYKFVFNSNSTYSVKAGEQKKKVGIWQIDDLVLTTKIDGITTKYRYAFNKGYLILALSKSSYIVLGKDKAYFQNLLEKAKNSSVTQKSLLTDAQFLQLLQNYATMPPNSVYIALTRMSKSQQSWIPIFQAWYEMLMFRACQGNMAYKNPTDAQACAYVKAQYQSTLKLLQGFNGALGDPWSEAKIQNGKLITQYLKKLGKIDSATYNTYMGVQQNINSMQNQTTNTIIDNFKPLPCVEHYEQGTNAYLGCY